MTKSYQISKDIYIETMPHAMYFTGDSDTVTKINHVPYQTIVYNDNSMFTAKLMNDAPIEIFIDNGATPSILPLLRSAFFWLLCKQPFVCKLLFLVFMQDAPCLVCWFSHSFVSEACACFWGMFCERLCTSRSLLGSYVHQESI